MCGGTHEHKISPNPDYIRPSKVGFLSAPLLAAGHTLRSCCSSAERRYERYASPPVGRKAETGKRQRWCRWHDESIAVRRHLILQSNQWIIVSVPLVVATYDDVRICKELRVFYINAKRSLHFGVVGMCLYSLFLETFQTLHFAHRRDHLRLGQTIKVPTPADARAPERCYPLTTSSPNLEFSELEKQPAAFICGHITYTQWQASGSPSETLAQ